MLVMALVVLVSSLYLRQQLPLIAGCVPPTAINADVVSVLGLSLVGASLLCFFALVIMTVNHGKPLKRYLNGAVHRVWIVPLLQEDALAVDHKAVMLSVAPLFVATVTAFVVFHVNWSYEDMDGILRGKRGRWCYDDSFCV